LQEQINLIELRSICVTGANSLQVNQSMNQDEAELHYELASLALTKQIQLPDAWMSLQRENLVKLRSELLSMQGGNPDSTNQIQIASQGQGCYRIDAQYLEAVTTLIADTQLMSLTDALQTMVIEVMNYMTKTFPASSHEWSTVHSARQKLHQFAEVHCGGSFRTCYTCETPVPIYKIVSLLFHASDRCDESGMLSDAIRNCAFFYKGLDTEFADNPDTKVACGTVWRGLRYNFPNFATYYKQGTELVIYEPKSASRDRLQASAFATAYGTLYEIRLSKAYDMKSMSVYSAEDELVLPLGSTFKVCSAIANEGGPNLVVLQQTEQR